MFTQILAGLAFILIVNQSNGFRTTIRGKEIVGKIVGGVPVDIVQFPHSVQVYNMGDMCAGSTLNAYSVLTAAHCFDLNRDVSSIYVISAARFSFDFKAPLHHVQLVVLHERYNISTLFACDIALVFLRNPIKFSKFAQKAVIINTGEWMNEKETNFTVAGWGETTYKGFISKDGLLMAQMRYISLKKCMKLHNLNFTEDMFCLYGDGQRDACRGDSGGGVIWKGMMVGITSHGDKCAKKDSPSIYANVWYFRNWIKKHIDIFATIFCHKNLTKYYRRSKHPNWIF